jgi:hypothetical protein
MFGQVTKTVTLKTSAQALKLPECPNQILSLAKVDVALVRLRDGTSQRGVSDGQRSIFALDAFKRARFIDVCLKRYAALPATPRRQEPKS